MSQKPAAAVAQSVVSVDATQAALSAAVACAERLGIRVCVAVYDSGCTLSGFLRMPGSFHVSNEMSLTKAKTVASVGLPMEVLDEVLDADKPRIRRGLEALPGFTPVHGALPIIVGGQLLGAVGVSGGSEDEDIQCAQAAVDAVNEQCV